MTADSLSGAPEPYRMRAARALRTTSDAIPPSGLVLLAILSVQVGAGLAKNLFDQLAPSAVVFLRIAIGAVILLAIARPKVRGLTRRDLGVAVAFGVSLGLMNLSFYEALARLPIGIAVAIEFIGPLTLAVVSSRRLLDLVWVALAAAGVILLAPWSQDGGANWAGIGFGVLAGAFWAGYIVLSSATGARFPGASGLSFALIVATIVTTPIGVASGGTGLLDPHILLVGAGVGLLSSAIPYTLELEALRRMPKQVFGILMSLEPAVAALVGLFVLGEVLKVHEWAAIGCVVAASIGATRARS
ncbi:EamA family transporter [Planotetraspora kaengkrachanensis]|uniref:Threonine transporter RhtB n=1 Tax=Planotetraspora kaengkrachanensis TaxID=575193 RepID=A0A8J3PXF1_9ACTN|nr:DMT family transporter [Planotetraspora kaengkrachanensis]GIG82860.1 threonine transporter RhtB [Planotetraspora kaengkrachanensis]